MKKIILLLSLIMIFYGIYSGEASSVLVKARNICMECIGID